jgi:transketolase
MRKTSLNMVYELAQKDERVLFIGSDLGPGVLDDFKKNIPERFFMEGITEQYIIGMAAGLAFDGFIPYVNTIATFLTRRCFEQLAVDLCLHDLPVRLIGNGGGLVYAPLGPTHQAIEDIGILRTLPNMTIVAPCDAEEMKRLMVASLDWPHPLYIRLAKGGDPIISKPELGFEIGRGIHLRDGQNVLFVTTGITAQRALAAAQSLGDEDIDCGVFHVHTIKPFDNKGLIQAAKSAELIVTIEEHVLNGGLGSVVLEAFSDHGVYKKVIRLGIPDVFAEKYGSQDIIMTGFGLDPGNIVKTVKNCLTQKR